MQGTKKKARYHRKRQKKRSIDIDKKEKINK